VAQRMAEVAEQTSRQVIANISAELQNKQMLRQHIARLFADVGSVPLRAWFLDIARDLGADEEIFIIGQAIESRAAPQAEAPQAPAEIPWQAIDQRVQQLVGPLQAQVEALPGLLRQMVAEEASRRPPMVAPAANFSIGPSPGGSYDPAARPAFGVSPGWGRR